MATTLTHAVCIRGHVVHLSSSRNHLVVGQSQHQFHAVFRCLTDEPIQSLPATPRFFGSLAPLRHPNEHLPAGSVGTLLLPADDLVILLQPLLVIHTSASASQWIDRKERKVWAADKHVDLKTASLKTPGWVCSAIQVELFSASLKAQVLSTVSPRSCIVCNRNNSSFKWCVSCRACQTLWSTCKSRLIEFGRSLRARSA